MTTPNTSSGPAHETPDSRLEVPREDAQGVGKPAGPDSTAATKPEPPTYAEFLTALTLRHIRLVPETPYGAELVDRLKAEVKALAFAKVKP